jgi:glycerol-3-phosphate dehydrogenase subunit C
MYDLRDPKFYDEADLDRELRRVFDVCHTCRMCFSYCPSFPSLFDAIDRHEEKGEGEVDALTRAEMEPVVDLCWQCKLCYVKCPYTPPHKFAVDFPRLLMRAKIVKVRMKGLALRERILGDPDRLARFSVGHAAAMVNWANRRPLLRGALEKLLGIHRRRQLPTFARTTFGKWFRRRKDRRTAGETITLFATCSVDYNFPQVGVAAVQVLEHAGYQVEVPDVVCCGLPALDGGDVEGAARKIRKNLKALAGKRVVVLSPSCGLMIKQEWPEIVPEARDVAAAAMDIGEFLVKEKVKLDIRVPQGKVAYHVPCHLRAQNVGQPFRALLQTPGTTVESIEQCSAFDGTWGMKTEYYETSRKCAGKLCGAIAQSGADRLMSDCMLAGLNMVEETGRAPQHPVEVLRDALGIAKQVR